MTFIRKALPAALFLLLVTSAYAQPKFGNDTLLDIGCWNIEWFGDATPGNGPDDEATQFNNVKAVLANADVDVWSLEEVSSPSAWNNLLAALPDYAGEISSFSQTQKTALIWKKDKFDFVFSQSVLTGSQYDYDFAGRPPLEILLKTKNTPVIDTIYFYVLHLKAYADQTSYGRRKNAAGYLKTFLDQNRPDKKFVVLGDWNDELNGSTVSGNVSPFLNFQNDTAEYFYICKQLSDQGKKSYANSSGRMIDHIMISTWMKEFYVPGSSQVLDILPNYISGYSRNTSDHYPVMGFFNMKRDTPSHVGIAGVHEAVRFDLFPNPVQSTLHVQSPVSITQVSITDLSGNVILTIEGQTKREATIQLDEAFVNGIYFMQIVTSEGLAHRMFVLQR